MKKTLILLLAVCSAAVLRAQGYFPGADPHPYPPFADSWKADPMMVTGNYLMYRMDTPAPTKVPSGYKPFYISTYGRHGARFFGRNEMYDTIARLFDAADAQGALTPDGEEFRSRFQRLYPLAKGRGGDLTQLGVAQQRELARKMIREYPAVFQNRKEVDARSTTVPRCILSMNAFCDELQASDGSLQISQTASVADMHYLKPNSKYNPKVRPDEVDSKMDVGKGTWLEPWQEMWRQTARPQAFFARLFKDPSFVEAFGDPVHLERECFYLMADTPCASNEIDFREFFDPEEAARLWQLENWRFYQVAGPGRTYKDRNWAYAEVLLDQIVRSAEEDMADGRTAARLRFGHDYMLVNLLTLLNLDGWNVVTEDFDRIKDVFRFSELPMATNLKLIFYHDRKGDVLVRAALNDREVRLHIDGAEGPYYRWEDFKTFCRERISLAQAILQDGLSAGTAAFDEIRETPAKGYGIYYVAEAPAIEASPAPKGYKPVYISTYSRHGARYILFEKMYTDIHTALDKAHRGRLLTPAGEDFYRRFEAVNPQLENRSGALTPLGRSQHKALGKSFYEQYPEFWKHRPHIEARATNLPRVIMSMNACLEALKEEDPALRWNATCAKAEMGYLNPHSGLRKEYAEPGASGQYLFHNTAAWQDGMMEIFREKVDCKAFIQRYFTNGSILEDPEGFMLFCYYLAGDMYSLPELETKFDDLFTLEEILGLWEADNYLYYSQKGPDPLYSGRGMAVAWEMLNDIIVKTDADLVEYPYAARLRFGHDGCMMALFAFMGLDRWGEVVSRDQVKDVWQTYKVPMASSMQFVFYRNPKQDGLLFKMLYNGKNQTLPFPAVDFPYYSWEAFKAFYEPRIAAAKEHLANLDPSGKPYVLEGRVTCEGKGVPGVAVTDGVNIVRTDAEGRYRMASDKRQGLVYLTTPSGYRAVSTDGLQPDFYAHLTAAPGVKEVHDFTLVREDQSRYSVIFLPDAHLSNADFKPELESFRDIAMPTIRTQAALLSAEGPVYTVNLGDLSHDIYWYDYNFTLEDDYRFLLELKYPTLMYSVSGNHDNDPSVTTDHTDFDSEHVFRKVFGPEHYSVDIGGDHWIMLDDIQYINVPGQGKKAKGVKGDRSYDKGLTDDAWHWLEQDVAGLPDGTPVRICVHSPIVYHNAGGTLFSVGDTRRLSDLLERFAPVWVYAGHVHHMHWLQREEWPVFQEADLPAVSGTMWTTRPNRVLSNNGEDAGILVGRYSGGAVDYTYQTYRHGACAMRLYDMNAVARRYASDKDIRALLAACPGRDDYSARQYRNCVYINYWMLRDGETVEALEDGRPLEVEQVNDEDPLYLLNLHLPDFLETGKHSRGKVGNLHMFRTQARSARTPVTVRVRNAAGEIVREAVLQRPGKFDENM